MIVDCISDLHGHYPKLGSGDLLIVAGDLTAKDEPEQHVDFCDWLDVQAYTFKVVIAGNHDNAIDEDLIECLKNTVYLCDSGTEFEGLKIWGSPWSLKFEGMNPHCMAFTGSEADLAKKFALIPQDVDILVTHGPAYGILDKTTDGKCVGSKSLQMELFYRLNPRLFVCGHIHESYGIEHIGGITQKAINASHVNEHYEPVNDPITVIL